MGCVYCRDKNNTNSKTPKVFITERHIQALWLEQKYLSALYTTKGSPIEVISPGIWNLGAGPDFQKAHLLVDGKSLHGDIELHLSEDAWYQHHHHHDAHYNNVILHVALWKAFTDKPILTANQNPIPRLHLEPFLNVPIERLTQLIDLDLYPYKQFVGAGRCARALFKNISEEEISQLFQSAADWRLEKKRAYFKSKISNPQDYIAGGIAMALGYKNNAYAFLELFLELKTRKFFSENEILAWLLGKTGFFETRFNEKWNQNPFYAQLKQLYFKETDKNRVSLLLTQIRPLNHPIRRLVILAKLAIDIEPQFLMDKAYNLWQRHYSQSSGKKRRNTFIKEVKALLPDYQDAYWNKHYLFEAHASKVEVSLLGGELKREIILNVLFPFLAERISNKSEKEMEAFKECYRHLTASKAGKSNYLTHRFFGNGAKGSLLKKAYNVQGAYQIHYDYCFHYEASCEGCPFVEHYQASRSYQPSRGCDCSLPSLNQ